MSSGDLAITLVAALLAAASFGSTGAMQHHASQRVPDRGPLRIRLILDLLHQPLWVAAIVLNVLGIAMQFLALRFGPLLFVQPLLVTSLLFAALTGAYLARRRPDRVILAGVGLTIAGLIGFLVVAQPAGGEEGQFTGAHALPLGLGLTLVLAGCLAASRVAKGMGRALLLALGCGILYGVTAGLIKVVVDQTAEGLLEPLRHWPMWVVVVVGPLGFLLNQSAFRAEPIVAPALAVITTVDPLVGIGIGLLWLDETVRTAPWAIALQVVFLAMLAGGVTALARRAPEVAGTERRAEPTSVGS